MNKYKRSELIAQVKRGLLAAVFCYAMYVALLLLLKFVLVPTWKFIF